MPRQNRVTPSGELLATPERGTFMGNRGVLHDAEGHIKRAWALKRWIVCLLAFKGRKRQVMTPNRYTELFFLDEAVALAAGHRPCAECRHARFIAFWNAWRRANPGDGASRLTAVTIDNRLHDERVAPDGSRRSYAATLDELPDGVFVTSAGWGEQAYLVWRDHLLAWSPGSYGEKRRWAKYGDVVGWLTSPIFDLKQARLTEAEEVIEAAKAFMRRESESLPPGLKTRGEIDQRLRELLDG